VPDLFSEQLDH
jgi:hypothetical protein